MIKINIMGQQLVFEGHCLSGQNVVEEGRTTTTINGNKQKAKRATGHSLMLLVVIVVAFFQESLVQDKLFAEAAPAPVPRHSSEQQQQQQQQDSSSNSLEYMSPMESGSRMWLIGPSSNSKRARKTSAFMPMRGRRTSSSTAVDWEAWPGRENEDEELGLPLDSAHFVKIDQYQQQPATYRDQRVMMVPTGFVAQHLLHQDGTSLSSGNPVQLMEAKPRRAFQPMRGKKSPEFTPNNDEINSNNSEQIFWEN